MARKSLQALKAQIEELSLRLEEAQGALEAIRTGQVESLVVEGLDGPRIFSLEGASHSYRILVEAMCEGAVTFTCDGTILYCNLRFARMLDAPLHHVMGGNIHASITGSSNSSFEDLLREALRGESRGEIVLQTRGGKEIPAQVAISAIADGARRVFCAVATDLTQQKQELDRILSSMSESLLVFDSEARVVRANAAAARVLGFDPVGLSRADLGRRVTLRWPDGRRLRLEEIPSERALRGEVVGGVRIVLERDGARLSFRASASPLYAGGCITGAVSVWHEMTEYDRIQELALESQARLGSVMEQSLDCIYRYNLKAQSYDYISPACERIVGFSADELRAKDAESAFAMIHPDDQEGMRAALVRLGDAGEAEVEYRQRTKEGGFRWISNHMSLIRDERGQPLYRNGTIRDVTERKRAEEALREANENLEARVLQRTAELANSNRALEDEVAQRRRAQADLESERRRLYGVLETLPAMICLLTRDHRVAFANRAFRERFGEASGEHCYEYCFGLEAPCSFCEAFRVLETGRPHSWEVRTPDGSVIEAHDFPFADVDGTSLILEMDLDVTKARHDEAALKELNATLEKRVSERTAQLNEADRRKTEFLGMLSHELRNPLAPIRNSLHILDRARPGGEQARRAQAVIDRQVSHLTHLVDDLLDITRITRGKIRLQRAPVDLVDVVRRTVEDHRSLLEERHIVVDLPKDPIWILGDQNRLAQVVGNLLNNAAKFTPDGGKVAVSVATTEGSATVRIADSGLGIDPQILESLFEPFAQADRSLDRSRGGLGLGLALVKGIAELHGGTVKAYSDGPGRGAQFAVTLPVNAHTQEATVARASPGPAQVAGMNRRILVIEDNKDAAISLAEVLGLAGHHVEIVFSGADGVAKARECQPEVVLCDIGLPGMDGYAVARALRRDAEGAGVFLVALTGYAQPEDQQRAREAGFDAHLAKPPDLASLERILAKAPRPQVWLGEAAVPE